MLATDPNYSSSDGRSANSPIPPAILQKCVTMSVAPTARSRVFQAVHGSLNDVLNHISNHKWGAKDGLMLFPGLLEGPRRRQSAVVRLDVMMFDIDNGQSFDRVFDHLRESGMMYFMYTSYSHGKSITPVRVEHVLSSLGLEGEAEISAPALERYLAEVKDYDKAISSSIRKFCFVEGENGAREIRIYHAPMDKFRVGLPLAEPFHPRRYGSVKKAQLQWQGCLSAVAYSLGLRFDPACIDMSRGYYSPRHARGRPFRVESGGHRLLDLDDITPLKPQKERGQSVRTSSRIQGLGSQIRLEGNANYDGIGRQLRQMGPKLDVVDLLVNQIGWETRDEPGDGKVAILCPHNDAHSNPDDLSDAGCVAMNPEATDCGRAVITCRHAHCRHLHTAEFIGMILDQVALKECNS